VVSARGRCWKRPARRLIALRAPAAVRRTDVMVNYILRIKCDLNLSLAADCY